MAVVLISIYFRMYRYIFLCVCFYIIYRRACMSFTFVFVSCLCVLVCVLVWVYFLCCVTYSIHVFFIYCIYVSCNFHINSDKLLVLYGNELNQCRFGTLWFHHLFMFVTIESLLQILNILSKILRYVFVILFRR